MFHSMAVVMFLYSQGDIWKKVKPPLFPPSKKKNQKNPNKTNKPSHYSHQNYVETDRQDEEIAKE